MAAKQSDFLAFVADLFEVPQEDLSLDTAYESLPAWDSVMHLRLVLELGAAFGADIPVDKVADLKTLGDFYAYVANAPTEDR